MFKKLFCFIIVFLFSISCFVACDKNNDLEKIQAYLTETRNLYITDFFSNSTKPNTISIDYSNVQINDESINAQIDLSKDNINNNSYRYKSLVFMQYTLDNMMNVYEFWKDRFFLEMRKIENINQKNLNEFYKTSENLRKQLSEFKIAKLNFENEILTMENILNPSSITINIYCFEYNKLIDKVIDFTQKFIELNRLYIYDDLENLSQIQFNIDEAYFNISTFIYWENIKAFNFNVGSNGVCDLYDLMFEYYNNNSNSYLLIEELKNPTKILSSNIIEKFSSSSSEINNAIKLKEDFYRALNVFKQRKPVYSESLKQLDIYNLTIVKFRSNIDNYITGYSSTEIAHYTLIEDMRDNVFANLLAKLNTLVS